MLLAAFAQGGSFQSGGGGGSSARGGGGGGGTDTKRIMTQKCALFLICACAQPSSSLELSVCPLQSSF